jgi:hypothetical protein
LKAALASMDGIDPTWANENLPSQTARAPSEAPGLS